VRTLLRHLAFPGVLGSSLTVACLLLQAGAPYALAMPAAALAALPPLWALQRLLPWERTWSAPPRTFGVDLLHLLVSTGLTGALVHGAVLAGLLALADLRQATTAVAWWPAGAALPVQVGLAILLGDLGGYAVHRACHRWPALWRFHEVHHSSARLHALAGARNHPVNVALAQAGQALPLLLLGAGPEVLAWMGGFVAVHGLLQHANIAYADAPLHWLWATPRMHRFHHSPDRAESDSNFGNLTLVWDQLFGTWRNPEGQPRRAGLEGRQLPERWTAQIAAPFRQPS
jgi:sterol desaturase/sphingolipid hydroxylase (fatty acid hydroxylase superfamily)